MKHTVTRDRRRMLRADYAALGPYSLWALLFILVPLVSFSGQTFPCLDKDFGRNVPVDVVVRPEDVDIVPLEQGQLTGVVTSVTFMGVHYEIIVDVGGFKWMVQTTDFVDVDEHIGIVLEPDAIHIMKKSEYSNRYGDYSSFSNELEELSEIAEEEAE